MASRFHVNSSLRGGSCLRRLKYGRTRFSWLLERAFSSDVVRKRVQVLPQGRLELHLTGDVDNNVGRGKLPAIKLETENEKCDMVEICVHAKDADLTEVKEDGNGGAIVTSPLSPGMTLTGLIPEKFSLIAKTGGASIQLARIEGMVDIDSNGGSIHLDKVNEGPCKVSSGGGAVSCRVINGDAFIRTGGGNFSSKRITGMRIDADAAAGDIDIRAVYATHIRILGRSITCGSAHGNTTLQTTGGDVAIESGFDGNLEVQTNGGRCDVQLGSSAEKIYVSTVSGDISLRLPQDLEAKIEARGRRGVLIDEALKDSVGYADVTCQVATGRVMAKKQTSGARGYTPTQATVLVDAGTGFVELRGKDWLSSLGSKFQQLRNL